MLRNTLKGILGDKSFAELRIDPTRRAKDLAVADYVAIANYVKREV